MSTEHTPGFARILNWDAEMQKAHLRMGYASEDAPDDQFTFATWADFRSEADAREFVRRWNAHERLLAAAKAAVSYVAIGCANSMKSTKEGRARAGRVFTELKAAIAQAEGGAP